MSLQTLSAAESSLFRACTAIRQIIELLNNQFTAPKTKTAAFTVGTAESSFVCNGGGSITVTLPAASISTGRRIWLKTIAAQTVVSATSNVCPIDTAVAGTAILAATAGKWAILQSDGTNWINMASN